ncbi:MAG: hypothetical protein RLZZ624_367 [Cyanobacteriota bacterium]|jgi:prolyl oligopeptidase
MRAPTRRRRQILQLLIAGAAAGALPGLGRPGRAQTAVRSQGLAAPSLPPPARIEPVREVLWGSTVTDPYRWMERQDDPEWLPFLKAQAEYSRAVLDAIPGRSALGRRVSALSAQVPRAVRVISRGQRLFYESRPAGADQYKLFVRQGTQGPERLLLDPEQLSPGDTSYAIDWWLPSPQGRHIALGLSAGGSENSVLRILDVERGTFLNESIDKTDNASPSWLPDGSGFFYNRLAPGPRPGDPDHFLNSAAWLHRLGTDPAQDVLVLRCGLDPAIPGTPEEYPTVEAAADSAFVVACFRGGVRQDNAFHVARLEELLAGRPQWKQVCSLEDQIVRLVLSGDHLDLVSTRNNPNGQVLRLDAAAPDLARARVVVPESTWAIDAISAAADGLYLKEMQGGYSRLRRLSGDGVLQQVRLPFEGSIAELSSDPLHGGAWFIGESWLVPPACFHCRSGARTASRVDLVGKVRLDGRGYALTRSVAIARDGTRVPMSILARRDLKRDGTHPTLVEAYGAYQISSEPWFFNGRLLAFLEQGGVFVTAHVRGGGEFGRRWWLAGQKTTKPNTWRDLIDCCQTLIEEGWTSPSHLAITGTSAGGITVGRAMTERPELFAAVISDVGLSNPLRAEFSENGPGNIDEFGTINERQGFESLRQMDAYQAVRNGVSYPATLLTTGMNDSRVAPWQVGKMTARLQNVATADRPVLQRVDFQAGHGLGSTRSQNDGLQADIYAFVLWRTGHPDFQPRLR